MTAPKSETRLQTSHDMRKNFELFAYLAGGCIFVLVCVLTIIGIIWPPSARCLPSVAACAAPPDWGKAIVEKAVEARGLFMDMMMGLGGWCGITLARGHMDARLNNPPK